MSKTYKARCTLYTDDADFDIYKRMYKECNSVECLTNDTIIDAVYEYIADCKQIEFDDFIFGIKDTDRLVLVTGTLSRWNGYSNIVAVKKLENVLHNALEDYNTFKFDNGVLTLTAVHHDGTNIFEMRPLTKKGVKYYERHKFDHNLKEPLAYMISKKPYCIGKFTLEEVTW